MMFHVLVKRRVFLFVLPALFLGLLHSPVHAQSRGQRGSMAPATEGPPLGKSATEKQILAVLDDLDRNQRSRLAVPVEDARLLRLLTESINAKHVVELGTANGYSGIWFALALQATGGKLTTFEIDPQRAQQARENFKRAGVDHLITQVEGDAHQEVTKLTGPIDLVFIDADKDGYVDYLNKLLPLVRPGGLVVAHNMRVPPPDPQYIKAITTNPALESVFLNMHSAGIAVTLKKR
jgi:predicted O-methyltransferase YrrM